MLSIAIVWAADFSVLNEDGVTIYYKITDATDKAVEVTYHSGSSMFSTPDTWSLFTNIQSLEENIVTDKSYILDCNNQTGWEVNANSKLQAIFTNVLTDYMPVVVEGSVIQSPSAAGDTTYTSLLFYLSEVSTLSMQVVA